MRQIREASHSASRSGSLGGPSSAVSHDEAAGLRFTAGGKDVKVTLFSPAGERFVKMSDAGKSNPSRRYTVIEVNDAHVLTKLAAAEIIHVFCEISMRTTARRLTTSCGAAQHQQDSLHCLVIRKDSCHLQDQPLTFCSRKVQLRLEGDV
ncbi:hypothetical protein CB1_001033046 [Camelus ferus]|nr:hypothetical protein CB1_001033046 [Camelus ferus]